MKRSTLLVAGLLAIATPARADWLTQWELRGIRLVLTSADTIDGYVTWNPGRYVTRADTVLPPFPEGMFRHPTLKLEFYPDSVLRRVLYPDSGMLVAIAEPQKIPISDVAGAGPLPGRFDGYIGTTIPVVLPETAELLLTPPVAMAAMDITTGGPDFVRWLSYRPDVTEDQLRVLCSRPFVWCIHPSPALENEGIIGIRLVNE